MEDIYLSFPEKLLQGNSKKSESDTDKNEMNETINAELLRICILQKHLIDEQSAMIVEMLESMGRGEV